MLPLREEACWWWVEHVSDNNPVPESILLSAQHLTNLKIGSGFLLRSKEWRRQVNTAQPGPTNINTNFPEEFMFSGNKVAESHKCWLTLKYMATVSKGRRQRNRADIPPLYKRILLLHLEEPYINPPRVGLEKNNKARSQTNFQLPGFIEGTFHSREILLHMHADFREQEWGIETDASVLQVSEGWFVMSTGMGQQNCISS